MHASSEVAHKIFSSLRPYKLNIPEASRDRRLGTAIEVAPAIIQGPSAEMSRGVVKRAGDNNRIIVCTGGPNTYVPEHFLWGLRFKFNVSHNREKLGGSFWFWVCDE